MFLGKAEKGNNSSVLKLLTMTLSKYRIGLIAFAVMAVLMTMYVPRGSSIAEDTPQLAISHAMARPRLLQYCNRNITEGFEGRKFVGHGQWDLKYVVLTVRHGDRSAIHKIPGSADIKPAPGVNPHLDPDVLLHRPHLSKFSINLRHDENMIDKKNDDTEDIGVALDPSVAFQTPDLSLHQGQLTSIGFMQHINLGNALHNAYRELVEKVKSKDQLYIRSTKYARTIQSVTGLMISLLPNLGSTTDKTEVLVYENEEDEIMHGIGVRTSSRSVNHTAATGESVHFGGCAGAVSLAKKQSKAFIPSTAITNTMIGMFGADVTKLKTEEMADAAVPRFCHRQSLPCVAGDSSAGRSLKAASCMQVDLVEKMMRQTDRLYGEKYMGDHGGRNATKLALYPFMKEILSHLSGPTVASSDNTNRLMSLFSGHDTVIAPVLAALGVYHGDLAQWPPYASRVAFELWAPKEPPKPDTDLNFYYHVRVVYNGKDVTLSIPTCRNEKRNSAVKAGSEDVCSLAAFKKQINGMIAPYESIEKACIASDVN